SYQALVAPPQPNPQKLKMFFSPTLCLGSLQGWVPEKTSFFRLCSYIPTKNNICSILELFTKQNEKTLRIAEFVVIPFCRTVSFFLLRLSSFRPPGGQTESEYSARGTPLTRFILIARATPQPKSITAFATQ